MKVLIAEDNLTFRKILKGNLTKWDYEVIVTEDGNAAWEILRQEDAPHLAILDWIMPGKEGIDICADLRKLNKSSFTYIILLTANDRKEDIIQGFDAGADDYIIKPFNANELRSRVSAGARIVKLESALQENILELKNAIDNIKKLEGIIPMCAWCKKIRDDSNYWMQVEDYISSHSDSQFTHGICPDCYDKFASENDIVSKDEEPVDIG